MGSVISPRVMMPELGFILWRINRSFVKIPFHVSGWSYYGLLHMSFIKFLIQVWEKGNQTPCCLLVETLFLSLSLHNPQRSSLCEVPLGSLLLFVQLGYCKGELREARVIVTFRRKMTCAVVKYLCIHKAACGPLWESVIKGSVC